MQREKPEREEGWGWGATCASGRRADECWGFTLLRPSASFQSGSSPKQDFFVLFSTGGVKILYTDLYNDAVLKKHMFFMDPLFRTVITTHFFLPPGRARLKKVK